MHQIKGKRLAFLSFSQRSNALFTENNEIQESFHIYNNASHNIIQTAIFAFWIVNSSFLINNFPWGKWVRVTKHIFSRKIESNNTNIQRCCTM